MIDKSAIEQIIERTPLFVIVIGAVIFIIGAAGGVPLGSLPLVIGDLGWRIALASVGLLLIILGVVLLLREAAVPRSGFRAKLPPLSVKPEDFFIWLDHSARPRFEELFKDATRVCIVAKTAVNVLGGHSQAFKDVAERGGVLQFMFPDPSAPSTRFIYGGNRARYKANIEVTKRVLTEIKQAAGRKLQVRAMKQVPNMAMLIVERKKPYESRILIKLYFIHALIERVPMFLVPYGDMWYEAFIEEFDSLWKEAEPWDFEETE